MGTIKSQHPGDENQFSIFQFTDFWNSLIHKEDAVCLKLLAVKRTFFIDFELFKLELQVKKSNYTISHINY